MARCHRSDLGDVRGTIDLALRLQPDTKNVVVIGGTSEFEQYWLKIINQELRHYEPRLKSTDLVGLAPDELLKEVAGLPPHNCSLSVGSRVGTAGDGNL